MCYTDFVANRNITLSLPEELLREAKIHAAEQDSTVNAFVRELLQEVLSRESRVRTAAGRFLALAGKAACSRVDPASIRREELYERR
jgi:plasmid stability protein